eukprot:GFKZ01006661.1.p1 GENE.GFKZ01006661.1~~GFKZ01006661.1.p1  ORF type:complete len:511 (-),score=47.59 GFKZ01006661.1:104-1564(-)
MSAFAPPPQTLHTTPPPLPVPTAPTSLLPACLRRTTRYLLSRVAFMGGSRAKFHRRGTPRRRPPGVPPGVPPVCSAYLASSPPPQDARGALVRGVEGRLRVVLLISDTGGGHRASAEAMADAFHELFPERVETVITDFFTEIVGRPFAQFPQSYSFLAKNPPLWRFLWSYGKFPFTRRLTEEFSNLVGHGNFRQFLERFAPDLVVSVHPLTQFIPMRVLRTLPHPPPFVTVCTDLGGAHPTWFHRGVDLCFVPSDRVRRIARKCGLRDTQLRQYGLPVRAAFWTNEVGKEGMQQRLGLHVGVPTVLIVGGGDGVGGVGRIAARVAERVERELGSRGGQVVVVCGRNVRLRAELEGRGWPVRVVVKGFVDNMSEWMAASDLIVSKAGPGTIAEALIRGLPIVLSGFLPGQEAPNVRFVTDAGVGAFSRDPDTIAEIVTDWMADPEGLRERGERAKRMGRPNATYEIVREIARLVGLAETEDLTTPMV